MISALLLQASLGAIGRQALPPAGCAAFLWTTGEQRQLVAMATAEPGALRLQLDGKPLDLLRTSADAPGGRGLAAVTRYEGGGVAATLTVSVVERPDLADGAVVPDALLSVERTGADTLLTPLAGLIGCSPAK